MTKHLQAKPTIAERLCRRSLAFLLLAAALLGAAPPADAGLKQFDVFFGYDNVVADGNWFPVAFEVLNDGPAFEAIFEVLPSQFSRGQVRRMRVELPTGTRKRFVMPVFNSTRGHASWDVVVRDSRGVKRDEIRDLRPKRTAAIQAPILGAMVRSVGGLPVLPEVDRSYASLQPAVARLQPELFPDNPIALEGLAAIYLNAEKAQDLKDNQIKALLAWLSGGGHLIVALHQPSDLQASPWLRDLAPFAPGGQQNLACQARLSAWVSEPSKRLWLLPANRETEHPGFRNLKPDLNFAAGETPVVTGQPRGGQVLLEDNQTPLVICGQQARGWVTVLTFSPETEPFRSWVNRKYFWAKLLDVPTEWFSPAKKGAYYDYGGTVKDGIFGVITDSRQVRKLPVGWLLLLLVTYLAVIGPLDQYVLKKLNKQMFTWLTFPAYVLLFSGLIYFIGYKLRAGDIEWNEFHVADVIPRGDGGAVLRGYGFASIYSPVNARYPLASSLTYAALREEYAGAYGGGFDSGRSFIDQKANSFEAEVSVPVWTSQMYVEDWWHAAQPAPVAVEASRQGGDWQVKIENHLGRKLSRVTIVANGRSHELGEVPARGSHTFAADSNAGKPIATLVVEHADRFYQAANSRRSALGNNNAFVPNTPEEILRWTVAASFLATFQDQQNYRRFQPSRGFDLAPLAMRDEVILFALLEDELLVAPMNEKKFAPRRSKFGTVIRLVLPAAKSN